MDNPEPPKPGDLILNRILPDADPETRERAREALGRYGLALLRLGEAVEERQKFEVASRSEQEPEYIPYWGA